MLTDEDVCPENKQQWTLIQTTCCFSEEINNLMAEHLSLYGDLFADQVIILNVSYIYMTYTLNSIRV